MRVETLGVEVELVDPDVRIAQVEYLEPLRVRDADLDHETAARQQVRGGVREDVDLPVLGRDVVDRVADDVDERERPLDAGGGHVPDRDRDRIRLPLQLRDHVRREVDARYLYAALGKRHRDPAGADRELEGAAGREREEEV